MEQQKKERISELTRIARERPLTAEEMAERQALREEYLELWRRSVTGVLDNTWIETPDGRRTRLRRKGGAQ